MERAVVREGWRPPLYLTFWIYLFRAILFLPGKRQVRARLFEENVIKREVVNLILSRQTSWINYSTIYALHSTKLNFSVTVTCNSIWKIWHAQLFWPLCKPWRIIPSLLNSYKSQQHVEPYLVFTQTSQPLIKETMQIMMRTCYTNNHSFSAVFEL